MANDRFQSIHCGPSDRGIRADGIGLGSGNRYSRSLQLQLVQLVAQFVIVRIVATEDWDFKTVKSSRFDLFQMAIVLLSHMSGPEQQVHADFHSFWGMVGVWCPKHLDEIFKFASPSPYLNKIQTAVRTISIFGSKTGALLAPDM